MQRYLISVKEKQILRKNKHGYKKSLSRVKQRKIGMKIKTITAKSDGNCGRNTSTTFKKEREPLCAPKMMYPIKELGRNYSVCTNELSFLLSFS
jgi:hypothetical protein